MPATRPEPISNRIRLAYEFAAAVPAFVSEHSAVDSALPAVIEESAPHKQRIARVCSEHNLFAWADEQSPLSAVSVLVCAVMPVVEFKAVKIAILCHPPKTHNYAFKPTTGRLFGLLGRGRPVAA